MARAARVAKVTISLPVSLLAEVERWQRERDETRSEVIRRALERALREEREREADERYIRGYQEQPETEEELSWATGIRSLDEVPWEPERKK